MLSIELPEFVEKIHDSSFGGCVSLRKIDVHTNNKKYDSRNACNAIVETKSNKIVVACQNLAEVKERIQDMLDFTIVSA